MAQVGRRSVARGDREPKLSQPMASWKNLQPATCNLQTNMFTGIVEEAGVVEAIKPTSKSIALTVRTGALARGIKLGASVAVNGCCLTVVKISTKGKSKFLQF